MSRITIQPNQCSWKNEQVAVSEKALPTHKKHFISFAPFMLSSLLGIPQLNLAALAIVSIYIIAGSLSETETYEEEFIRRLKEDLR